LHQRVRLQPCALNIRLDLEIVNAAAGPAFLVGGIAGPAGGAEARDDGGRTSAEDDRLGKNHDTPDDGT